jgi:hypothetical protein
MGDGAQEGKGFAAGIAMASKRGKEGIPLLPRHEAM